MSIRSIWASFRCIFCRKLDVFETTTVFCRYTSREDHYRIQLQLSLDNIQLHTLREEWAKFPQISQPNPPTFRVPNEEGNTYGREEEKAGRRKKVSRRSSNDPFFLPPTNSTHSPSYNFFWLKFLINIYHHSFRVQSRNNLLFIYNFWKS